MKLNDLQKLMERAGGAKLLAAAEGEHDVFEIENITLETDMTSSELVLVFVVNDEPYSTSARDFEPHPAFEDINAWLYSYPDAK